jgi:hypothetical protein
LPIQHLEIEFESGKLEKKVVACFRKPGKTLEYGRKPWWELVNSYADAVFSGVFATLAEKEWLQQVDFLLCLDAGVKDTFPPQVLHRVAQWEFEKVVLSAHDRAYEEQRNLPIMWAAVQEMVDGPKAKKKVYNSIEEGWKAAYQTLGGWHHNPAQQFVGTWIDSSISILSAVSQQEPQWVLDPNVADQLFSRFIAEGIIPYSIVAEHGAPPHVWRFISQAVHRAYGMHATVEEQPAKKKAKKTPAAKPRKPLPSYLQELPENTCRNFVMGNCYRADTCKFFHDEDVKAEVELKRALEEAEVGASYEPEVDATGMYEWPSNLPV